MQKQGKKPAIIATIGGAGLFTAERGIDVSGIVNTPLAISLWFIGGILIVVALILWIKYYFLSSDHKNFNVEQNGLQISKFQRNRLIKLRRNIRDIDTLRKNLVEQMKSEYGKEITTMSAIEQIALLNSLQEYRLNPTLEEKKKEFEYKHLQESILKLSDEIRNEEISNFISSYFNKSALCDAARLKHFAIDKTPHITELETVLASEFDSKIDSNIDAILNDVIVAINKELNKTK